ncbi:hypothetical protein [Paenibacillus chitinolyticus]
MNNQETNQTKAGTGGFSFVWNGGFSYITYLKKKSNVTISSDRLMIAVQNFILGAFPSSLKTTELTFSNIKTVSIGSRINWFDLIFSTLFIIVTVISKSLWPLLLTAFFLWRTFNTCICITEHHGNKIRILTNSKASANTFVQTISQVVNQYIETAASVENGALLEVSQPLIPTVENNKKKMIFLFTSTAIVAIAILFVSIQSKGGFNNKYVEWVKEGTITGTDLKMSQVLENKTYFSNVEWKEVQEEGNNLDKFVMYQATFSDQGVKVAIRTVFQVFGENHYEAVETSSDGEILHTSDWYVFLADMADRYKNVAPPVKTTQIMEPKQEQSPAAEETRTPSEDSSAKSSNVTTPKTDESNLTSFTKWSPSGPDVTVPLQLDGEKVDLQVGLDSPNGVKILALSETLKQGWSLQLDTNVGGGSPFDDLGDLKEGFNLYIKDYNFENDTTPEVVIAASDGKLETYVWVFGYNYLFTENGTSPLDLIWHGEGQSDVILEGNKILLPFGSQGLFDEYVFSNNTFMKQ